MKDFEDEEQECLEAWDVSLRLRLTLSNIMEERLSSFFPPPACSSTTLRLQRWDLLQCETAAKGRVHVDRREAFRSQVQVE